MQQVLRINRTDVVVLENVHIVQSDVTDRDVHHGSAAHPKKDAAIANVHEKEADATTRVEALTATEDQEAVIVMHLAQVELAIAVATTTVNGNLRMAFSFKSKKKQINQIINKMN